MVTTPRLTYQDYADLEGDERYELLDGELILVAFTEQRSPVGQCTPADPYALVR